MKNDLIKLKKVGQISDFDDNGADAKMPAGRVSDSCSCSSHII